MTPLLLALGCGSGGSVAPPGPSDQLASFDDQAPIFDQDQQQPFTLEELCFRLCSSLVDCFPLGECVSTCLDGALGQDEGAFLDIEACFGEQLPPVNVIRDTGGPPVGMMCTPQTQCQGCSDPCSTCLCQTGGDQTTCEMQGACAPPQF